MADSIGTYFAPFVADMKGFTQPLRDAQKQSNELLGAARPLTTLFKDIGDGATRLGTALSLSVTAPIVAFGAIAVKNFDESAQAVAQLEAALISTGGVAGRTSEQLQALAKSLEAKSLQDDDAILRGIIDTLLQFGSIAGDTFDRASQAALDLSQRLGKDLQASAILVGKALDDPIKGLAALSKAGVTFTEAQKDVIKQLVETGHKAEAQNIILDELAKKFEGAAEAASKAGTGPMKQFTIQLGNMSESWGKLITETMNPFIVKATEVVKWIDTWSDSSKVLVGSAAGIAGAIGPAVFTFGQLSLGAANMIPLITKLSTVFLGAEGSALLFSKTLAAIPWAGVAAGAALLGFEIGKLINKWIEASGHQETFDKVLNTIVKTIPGFSLLATGTAQADDAAKSYNKTLQAQQKYLRDSGKTLADLSKTTADAAKKQDALEANLKLLTSAAAASAARVTDLENAHKAATFQTEEQRKAAEKLKATIDGIVKSVTGDTEQTKALTGAIKALQAAHVPAEEIVRKLGSQLQAEAEFAKASGRELNSTLAPLNAMRIARQAIIDQGPLHVIPADLAKQTEEGSKAIAAWSQATQEKLAEVRQAQFSAVQAQMQGIIDIADQTIPEFQRAIDHIDGINDASAQHQKETIDATAKAQQDAAETVKQVWTTAAGNITTGMAKAFTDVLFHGGNFKDSMVNLAKDIAEQMLQSILVGFLAPLTAKLAGLGGQLAGMIPGMGGAAGTAGTAAGAAGAATGGGGAAGAVAGFLTNPWTIAIAGGVLAVGAWLKSQAHHEANELVQKIENPFWKAWGEILPTDNVAELAAMDPAKAAEIAKLLQELNANYLALGNEFALGGKDEALVWKQSQANTQPHMKRVLDALQQAMSGETNAATAAATAPPGMSWNPATGMWETPDHAMLRKIYGFEGGTDYVTRTGPAILHQGEAVLTKQENAERRGARDWSISLNFYGDFNVSGGTGGQSASDWMREFLNTLRFDAEFKTQFLRVIGVSSY